MLCIKYALRISALLLCLLVAGFSTLSQAQEILPTIELFAGFHRIEAEVAANDATRRQGLMFRRSMPANHGMLFVFPTLARHCMWMKNTALPLSVAFLDENGHILNIEDMQPHTETNHCASAPARYALEMNLNWFAKKGVALGQRLNGIHKAPLPR